MAVYLSFLLILTGLTGIHSITTVSEVSVKAGRSISIPCLYDSQYRNNVKYLCKGYYWKSCSDAVKTNNQSSGKFSISDDRHQRVFTVTINDLTDEDTDYWCNVEIDGGRDDGRYFHLSVTRGTPSLYVDSQEITAGEGDNTTIKCYHHTSGVVKWCRLGGSCVSESSGSIAGTRVTIDKSVSNVFTVTMSGLRTEDSGWYWCVQGDVQMPVHLTVNEKPTTRIHSITTVSKVSVKAGRSISIPCLYDSQYRNHVKYLCKGYEWNSCSYAVKTNNQRSGKFSISDDRNQRVFTVTINDLTDQDTNYWCIVEINGGTDVGRYFHLSVTRGTPSLYVDSQEITGFIGEKTTIKCYHHTSGEVKWCRLGSSCVSESSGSIAGTRVTIDKSVSNVFTVTMSGLRTEDSGWYWCVKGDVQMPVHLTVNEKPTNTSRYSNTLSPFEHVNHTSVFASEAPTAQGEHLSFLTIFIIRLSLLVFLVMVTSFIWFMIKRHKQSKCSSATATEQQEEVRYITKTSSEVPRTE